MSESLLHKLGYARSTGEVKEPYQLLTVSFRFLTCRVPPSNSLSLNFYLKEEYNDEETARSLANFCSTLNLDDIVDLYKYLPEERGIDIMFDLEVVKTFEIDIDFVKRYLAYRGETHNPKFIVNEITGGLRVRSLGAPTYLDIDSYLLVLKNPLVSIKSMGSSMVEERLLNFSAPNRRTRGVVCAG